MSAGQDTVGHVPGPPFLINNHVCSLGVVSYSSLLIIQLLGIFCLAIGIFVQTESSFQDLNLGAIITSPAIVLIVIGAVLFIIGFCGCFGALLELFVLLIIVSFRCVSAPDLFNVTPHTHTHTHPRLHHSSGYLKVLCDPHSDIVG